MSGSAVSRRRIIDLTARKGCAQIDIGLCLRRVVARIRNCKSVADLLMVRSPEVITKEKQLVFNDVTADAAAIVVVRQVTEWAIVEIGAGVDSAVLDKFEGSTVERVSSGFQGDISHGTDSAAEFRFEVIRRNVNGLDRINRRNDDLQKSGTLIIVDAFNLIQI